MIKKITSLTRSKSTTSQTEKSSADDCRIISRQLTKHQLTIFICQGLMFLLMRRNAKTMRRKNGLQKTWMPQFRSIHVIFWNQASFIPS